MYSLLVQGVQGDPSGQRLYFVDFCLGGPPCCLHAMSILPDLQLPKQNKTDISQLLHQSQQNEVADLTGHSVHMSFRSQNWMRRMKRTKTTKAWRPRAAGAPERPGASAWRRVSWPTRLRKRRPSSTASRAASHRPRISKRCGVN